MTIASSHWLEPGSDVQRQFARAIPGASTPPRGSSCLAGSTSTPTWRCLSAARTANDTFETGTRAAAWGGTTTIIDFAIQRRGEALRQGLDAWLAKAEGNCAIDYGFHMIVSDVNDQSMKEMDMLVDEGVTSFKLFMAYPGVFYSTDAEILRAMQQASGDGATIMMHAENGIAIDLIVAETLARGETDPRFHAKSRPSTLEGEATHRAIRLAGVAGSPLYIVHLSPPRPSTPWCTRATRGGTSSLRRVRSICFFRTPISNGPGSRGPSTSARHPCAPSGIRAELWRGLKTNDLSVVSTDHCPFCFKEQKELGRGDFSKIPNGLPGVENRVDLIYQGVVRGDISVERWVEIIATTPARMFGLYPKKGVIAPGADADIVVYDPAARQTISAATHHMNVDYSVYEGMAITGRVETVLSRGVVVVDQGLFAGEKGHGRFLERGRNQYLI